MRVIYCGFLKTASRSICDFCKNVLNYDVYQGTKAKLHASDTDIIFDEFTLYDKDVESCFHKGEVENQDIYDFLDKNENMIAKEFPYFGMYKYIYSKFKDSKFILCIRDADSLFNSYMEFMNNYRDVQCLKINRALFGINSKIDESHRQIVKDVYEKHCKDVIEYFDDKPGSLLVLDFKKLDNCESEIFNFLGIEDDGTKLKNLKDKSH